MYSKRARAPAIVVCILLFYSYCWTLQPVCGFIYGFVRPHNDKLSLCNCALGFISIELIYLLIKRSNDQDQDQDGEILYFHRCSAYILWLRAHLVPMFYFDRRHAGMLTAHTTRTTADVCIQSSGQWTPICCCCCCCCCLLSRVLFPSIYIQPQLSNWRLSNFRP